jgi:hypothetical protein
MYQKKYDSYSIPEKYLRLNLPGFENLAGLMAVIFLKYYSYNLPDKYFDEI